MKLNDDIINETVEILISKYNISQQLLKELMKIHKIIECENILSIKLSRSDMITLLLNSVGSQLFTGSKDETIKLRMKLVERWDINDIDKEFSKNQKTQGKTLSHKVRVLSEQKWTNGKHWAKSFVAYSGLDSIFAGIAKSSKKDFAEEIPPFIKAPDLKDFQIELKEDLIRTLCKNGDKAKCLISLPTGGGKTRVAMEAYVEWLRPRFSEGKYMIWVAQSEELCEQAISSVKQVWSTKEFTESLWVYRFFGSQNNIDLDSFMDGGVVVCSINKLYNAIKSRSEVAEQIIKNCGAIIIDEAHRAVTMMYEILYSYSKELRGEDMFPICGLTATPGRSIDAHKLPNVFNYTLFTPRNLGEEFNENPLRFFRDNDYLATPIFLQLPTGINLDISDNINSEEDIEEYFVKKGNKELASNIIRNNKILNKLRSIPKGEPTLVYTCTVGHANLLSSLMNYFGRNSVSISSKTHNNVRYKYIEQFKSGEIDFIFNHSVLTTGFDAPKTQNIVICRPIFSDVLYEQIVGRGLRGVKFGGTKYCNIIDFCDTISRFGDQLSYVRYKEIWE